MKYVIGVDLGTSAVKCLLVNQRGEVVRTVSKSLRTIREHSGWSEQDPEEWVRQTLAGLAELRASAEVKAEEIEGISFSGQMHGLVLLDEDHGVLRNAILWNDTRTAEECRDIEEAVGKQRLLAIAKNAALEGFTLPKILWVRKHQPEVYDRAAVFLLPKDYLRYRLTGRVEAEISDASGTLMLDVSRKQWSREILEELDLNPEICPPLTESGAQTGTLLPEKARATGLSPDIRVFAGGADNACGAIGAGVLREGQTMGSIGTSGVILSPQDRLESTPQGEVHGFNHARPGVFYFMGVTLAAGDSLAWAKRFLGPNQHYSDFLSPLEEISPGSGGVLFSPYLSGERTPHADADIRGGWIGLDASHTSKHLIRSVVEGITFSLNESVELFRRKGKNIDRMVAIGGGARNHAWLQIQADVFNTEMVTLTNEQGPGMGAAMLAAVGTGWFDSLEECTQSFVKTGKTFQPDPKRVSVYRELFGIYQDIYKQTRGLSRRLKGFRQQ
ncbi:xylulokinase [Paludifilum halophilum]|uniref:Xylulose kinase n=1 Tax=Paludifilum halophilum TaxID=1642702 RepID=A0A235B915_9BACL|nr:xylulokinase [Paludifilum halophilum]OYD08784.1 xylulokinase [Paludifilum halophilum]